MGIIYFCLPVAEFPLHFQLSPGHNEFTIDWAQYAICIPRNMHQVLFRVAWVPVIEETGREKWSRQKDRLTLDTKYHISSLDSAYAYNVMVSLETGASKLM